MEIRPEPKKRKLAKIAGILDIAVGAVVVVLFLYNCSPLVQGDKVYLVPLALIGLPCAIIATVGGIHALRRDSRGWAIAGAMAAIVPLWLAGVPALVLTILAKDEFKSSKSVDQPNWRPCLVPFQG